MLRTWKFETDRFLKAHLAFFLQDYPMAVVSTAARGLIIYQLEGTPQEFKRVDSPLKHQHRCLAIFKDKKKQPTGKFSQVYLKCFCFPKLSPHKRVRVLLFSVNFFGCVLSLSFLFILNWTDLTERQLVASSLNGEKEVQGSIIPPYS